MDYYVWDALLQHYQRHMPKLVNIMRNWKSVLSLIQNDLLHAFIDSVSLILLLLGTLCRLSSEIIIIIIIIINV